MSKKQERYSVKEYAKLKDLSLSAIYKAIREERINFERIGSHYIILPEKSKCMSCKLCNLPTDGEKCYSKRCPA